MSEASWAGQPVLGAAPFFHHGTHLCGASLASPDGHWWWDGEQWRARDAESPTAA